MAHRIKDQLEVLNQSTALATPQTGMAAIGVVSGRVVAKGNSGEDIPVGIGHVVSDGDGTDLPTEKILKFTGGGVRVSDDPNGNATVVTIDNDGNNVTIAIDFTEDDWDSVPSFTISAEDLPFDGSPNLFVQVANEDGQIVNCGVVIDATGDIILSATAPFTGKALVSGGRGEEIIPSATGSTYSLPNAAFRMNTNGASVTFANVAMIPLSDGWMGYQIIAGSTYQVTFSVATVDTPLQLNCMHFERPVGNTSIQEIRLFRPFTPLETEPLRGKQVTFSVDLLAGTGFPNTAANGTNFSVTGTTNIPTSTKFTKINNKGEFTSQNVEIRAVESVYGIPTDAYARYSFTFNVPENIVQISLKFTHTPYGTGSNIPENYWFRIYRPALCIGATAQPFIPPATAEDRISLADRYQTILTTFRGAVTQGQVIVQDVVFPAEFMATPTCTYAVNESAPTAFFATPLTADMSSPTVNCAKLTRKATADSDAGFFRVFYGFAVNLW
jgi:hypothetical protein